MVVVVVVVVVLVVVVGVVVVVVVMVVMVGVIAVVAVVVVVVVVVPPVGGTCHMAACRKSTCTVGPRINAVRGSRNGTRDQGLSTTPVTPKLRWKAYIVTNIEKSQSKPVQFTHPCSWINSLIWFHRCMLYHCGPVPCGVSESAYTYYVTCDTTHTPSSTTKTVRPQSLSSAAPCQNPSPPKHHLYRREATNAKVCSRYPRLSTRRAENLHPIHKAYPSI